MMFSYAAMLEIFQQYSTGELSEGELRTAFRCWPLPALEAYVTDLACTVGHEKVAAFVEACDLPLRRSNRDRWRTNAGDVRLADFPQQ